MEQTHERYGEGGDYNEIYGDHLPASRLARDVDQAAEEGDYGDGAGPDRPSAGEADAGDRIQEAEKEEQIFEEPHMSA